MVFSRRPTFARLADYADRAGRQPRIMKVRLPEKPQAWTGWHPVHRRGSAMFDQIETERLRIRPLRPDDWQAVHAYASDEATMHFLPEGVLSEEQVRAFIDEHSREESMVFAVTLK